MFLHLSKALVDEFYSDNDASVKLWGGFRVLAVDGSKLTLPEVETLRAESGVVRCQSDTVVVQGQISVLYDVLNGFVIDWTLAPLCASERQQAMGHLEHTGKGDLILYDRGYPSFEMIYEHNKRGIDFLFMVRADFNSQVMTFMAGDKQTYTGFIYPSGHKRFP